MVMVAALEAIRTGTTTIVENVGNIQAHAAALADTGLRCVFAEAVRDSDNVAGPMAPERFAMSEAPSFSPRPTMRLMAKYGGSWALSTRM